MRIFSKAKFIASEGYDIYEICKKWVDECDGKEVIDGEIEDTGKSSVVAWEVEYDESNSKWI